MLVHKICPIDAKITTGLSLFAECQKHSARPFCTRQKALGVASAGKGVFAGCLLSGPRQKICRVPNFAECLTFNTRQRPKLCRMPKLRHSVKPRSLPSAKIPTLGKASSNAECKSDGTQQIWYFGSKQTLDTQICRVCRVFWPKHPAKLSKIQFYFCF